MARVLAVGPVFVDSIYAGLPCIPEAGQEVYGDRHLVTVGGFAITAIGLARLGLSPVIVSAVGGDLFGRFVEERLQAEGVSRRTGEAGAGHYYSTAMVLAGDRTKIRKYSRSTAVGKMGRAQRRRFPKSMHVDLVTDQRSSTILMKPSAKGLDFRYAVYR